MSESRKKYGERKFSIYVLSPDRRFIGGEEDLEKAKAEARGAALASRDSRGQKIRMAEVWDNKRSRPVYSVERKHGGHLEEHHE